MNLALKEFFRTTPFLLLRFVRRSLRVPQTEHNINISTADRCFYVTDNRQAFRVPSNPVPFIGLNIRNHSETGTAWSLKSGQLKNDN